MPWGALPHLLEGCLVAGQDASGFATAAVVVMNDSPNEEKIDASR
jgi:hypothetical protein